MAPAQRCNADISSKGRADRCKHPKGFGTKHLGWGRCKHHGGCTKSGELAAAREELAASHQLFGQSVDVDPGEGLLQEVARANGFIRFIERCLQDKGIDDATIQDPARLVLEMSDAGWQAQAWIKLWQEERVHFARVCKMALDAGIAERSLRIIEQFADLISDLVFGLIADLRLDANDPKIRAIANRQLMIVGQKVAASSTPLVAGATIG